MKSLYIDGGWGDAHDAVEFWNIYAKNSEKLYFKKILINLIGNCKFTNQFNTYVLWKPIMETIS